MEEDFSFFADIVLPLAVPQYYTYGIPKTHIDKITPGIRVIVALGKKRLYTGMVRKVHTIKPIGYSIRPILEILDVHPLVSEQHMSFWEWVADYYMCTVGEVYKAALPSGLKLESHTSVFPVVNGITTSELTPTESELLELVQDTPGITLNELIQRNTSKGTLKGIRQLVEKGLISLEEILHESVKERVKVNVILNAEFNNDELLNSTIDTLERKAKKQAALLKSFLNLTEYEEGKVQLAINRDELIKKSESSMTVFSALVSKGILCSENVVISRLGNHDSVGREPFLLSNPQQIAIDEIRAEFSRKDCVLLHGVTSSGKTEIYIQLIQEYLQAGKQVLYLLPEIALTTQIIQRLRMVFGATVGVYHSKFSDAERVEVYQNLAGIVRNGATEFKIILGVRSSIFLPFSRLGLIIVDEEHETTYKQFDPAPRYNARDASVVLAASHKAKVLMGTATPSFESYANALTGRYGLVELFERHHDMEMPEIQVVNLVDARHRKQMSTHFSSQLITTIAESLKAKEQIILFQNRRGFSPYVECNDCGWVPYCKNCDVSLTYHKSHNSLSCHYCGYAISHPSTCNTCLSSNITTRGFGTEKVEDEMMIHFPGIRISRMDMDTTRTRRAYERIIKDFEDQKIDILIGTQMVTKGLDFENVRVVGILNADNLLNFPDFRSFERSYQLMAQVSGRAGRKNTRGIVIIQTSNPKNTVIRHVVNNSYQVFFNEQLVERKNFKYPPFYRLVKLTLRHRQLFEVSKAANRLADELRKTLGERVVGPEFPLLNRVFNFHQKCIWIKVERDKLFGERRINIRNAITEVLTHEEFKGLQIIPDVDPYN